MDESGAAQACTAVVNVENRPIRPSGEAGIEFAPITKGKTGNGLSVVTRNARQFRGRIVVGFGVERGIRLRLVSFGLVRRIHREIESEEINRIAAEMLGQLDGRAA